MPLQKFGRYKTERLLGQGSMGAVYKAFDPLLKRHLAIKVMSGAAGADEEFSQRFFREAEATAGLNHPNIIAIYDIGEQDKQPYIVIEYLEGEDLDSILKKKAFIPFDRKLEFVIGVCQGLEHAHNQGVIHRDIKPSNIRVTPEGDIKILDFGIAKLVSSEMTATGILMGTPSYMSPEQVIGQDTLDGRSDVFSTGVILYQLITGEKPFPGSDFRTVMMAICNKAHPPPAKIFPAISEDLAGIVDRALAKQRDERFASAAELARALRKFRSTRLRPAVKSLALEVHNLESQIEELQTELSERGDPAVFDRDLLEMPVPADPEQTVLGAFSSQDLTDDYGWLLIRQKSLSGHLDRLRQLEPKRKEINELAESVRTALNQGQWENALERSEKILEWIPESRKALEWKHESLTGLKEKAREKEKEKEQQKEEKLDKARAWIAQGEFKSAANSVSELLKQDSTDTEGLRLKALAEEGLKRQKEIEAHAQRAGSLFEAGDFEACRREVAAGLRLDPGHSGLQELSGRIPAPEAPSSDRPQVSETEPTVVIQPGLPPEPVAAEPGETAAEPSAQPAPLAEAEETPPASTFPVWMGAAAGGVVFLILAILAVWYLLTPAPLPPLEYSAYQVQPGDTLADLAIRFQIEEEDLIEWNRLEEAGGLLPGRVIHTAPPPAESGRLTLRIMPWAQVESVVRTRDQAPVLQGAALTPLALTLPAGDYTLTLSHPQYGPEKMVLEVEIENEASWVETRSWPGFQAAQELDSLFGGQDDQ